MLTLCFLVAHDPRAKAYLLFQLLTFNPCW